MKRIGVITSGGDCGGLNAVIKGAAQMAHSMGIETVIIPNGYAGLYNLIDAESVTVLTPGRLDLIRAEMAGSEAGNSRVKIKKIDDENKYDRIKKGLDKFNIGGLVISGGDDTGSVIVDLAERGIACVHAPKTMDLDLQSYSVGGDSAINRIAAFIRELKTTGSTHNRVIVLEAFGRYAGHTAFRGGIGGDADCILIPEIPVDFDVVYEHMKKRFISRVENSDVKAGTYTIVAAEGMKDSKGEIIVDESAGTDAFGHKKLAGAGKYVRKRLEALMKNDPEMKDFMKRNGILVSGVYELPEIREVTPGHLVRSGASSAYDVNFGREVGAAAVVLLMRGLGGNTVIKVRGTKITYKPTAEVIKQRLVDLNTIAFHETLGTCFGRKPGEFRPELVEETGAIEREF
ncbi:MAG: 6-phosphofructokinase [Deferribacteres bacterium]|nr:6-phosphofructokinase [Deferribacteres bacterium]